MRYDAVVFDLLTALIYSWLPPRYDARPDFLEKSLEPLAGLF